MDRQGRQPRIHIPNTIHHVMIRGNNRQRVFFCEDDFYYFLNLLKEAAEKFDHKIILYCLMNNHAHLLIHIRESSLSSVMQKINYRYARFLNHKQKRIGHLFQGRYRSIEVGNDEYFINLCRYIHLNPVVANIVADASEYAWSSHHHYIKNNYPDWMDHELMISAIKNKTNLNYQDFMQQPVDRESWQPALYISDTGEIIHNDIMLDALQNEKRNTNCIMRKFLSEDQVSNIVCHQFNITQTQLLESSGNHRVAQQRILLANYLIRYSHKTMTDVAKSFHKTPGTLSRQLERFLEHPDEYFSKELLCHLECVLDQEMIKRNA